MEFEWDYLKERQNISKHSISFSEAIDTFFDPEGIELDDTNHSRIESRKYWIGRDKKNRILTTWFTRRNDVIRIIGSAEWRKFRRLYYETTKTK